MLSQHGKILCAVVLLLLAGGLNAQSRSVVIDTENSVIQWTGSSVTSRHTGFVMLLEGQIEVDGEKIRAGRFVMDMRSIETWGVAVGEAKLRLERHLKSADFFDVENHPIAIFQLSSATPTRQALPGETVYQIAGDLTIKGITHAINFEAIIDLSNEKAQAKGEFRIDRTRYGLQYRSDKFFEDLGDKLIYDDFLITFYIRSM